MKPRELSGNAEGIRTIIPKQEEGEQKAWGNSSGFFQTHRRRPEELYPSERFFLPHILKKISTCLDIGCATGGFSNIMKSFNPNLKYVGVDITPESIEIARETYPDSEFYIGNGANLPFVPNSFELVHLTGVLHHNSHYKEIVYSAYSLCSKYLLCDFRLTEGKEVIGRFDVKPEQSVPYIIVNMTETIDLLKSLKPRPVSIRAKGYTHDVSPMARISLTEAVMAFFLVRKGNEHNKHTLIKLNFSCPIKEAR